MFGECKDITKLKFLFSVCQGLRRSNFRKSYKNLGLSSIKSILECSKRKEHF